MNSNAAVFGICNSETGYGGPGQAGYPTSEQLSSFYGSTGGGGGPGGGGSDPGSPYHTHSGHPETRQSPPETKYEPNPSHSPGGHTTAGIISSDNGLQYANLDGSGYPAGHPNQPSYQAHHASLVQASYAHHYGTEAETRQIGHNLTFYMKVETTPF